MVLFFIVVYDKLLSFYNDGASRLIIESPGIVTTPGQHGNKLPVSGSLFICQTIQTQPP
jgi:hypothetical protein